MREEQLPSAGGAIRPGSMTTAMRAIVPSGVAGRLALRVAVARHGRVEREWILEAGELSVGRSEHADVVDAALPFDRLVLLRVTPGRADLVVPHDARGRVQSGGAPRGLEGLEGASLALDATARGRIVLGSGEDEVAILFQRVPAPPMRIRPALPLAVQQRLLDRVDWFFTAVAAASFMLHFAGIVALTEADWPMPASLAQIDERTAEILFAEEVPPPEVPSFTDSDTPRDTETPIAQTPVTETPSHTSSPRAPVTRTPTESIADVHAQVAMAVEMMIGAIGSDGTLANLVDEGGPTGSQAELLASVDGVAMASADPGALRERTSGGHMQPGPIGTLRRGAVDGGEHAEGAGPVTERAVRVVLDHDPDGDQVPMDPNWDERLLRSAVQRRMGAIQRCYEVELTRNPELAGRVTVSMQVEEIGTLSHVHATDDTTGSRTLSECVIGQIRSIRLQSGPEGGLVAQYPIVFAPQR